TTERVAEREYDLLRQVERLDFPAVGAGGIVPDRPDPTREPLEPPLVHPDPMARLLDALAVLIVRMPLAGFFWGDCSLSNTLFRRDAGAFAAYLVDAETGNLYPKLSEGQRSEDIEILRLNIFGELLDLQEGGLLDQNVDPEETVAEITGRYEALWAELTG